MLADLRTPAMGWNSWNAFGCRGLTESVVVETADALVTSGLRDAGYVFLVVDDCWQAPRRDPSGRLVADPVRFPSGMAAVADEVRARGLRLGMYLTPGGRTCAELWDRYGERGGLGSLGHERLDLETYAAWGVDYLKLDWCMAGTKGSGLQRESAFRRWGALIDGLDRPMVYSISDYGLSRPWTWAPGLAHSWRTTPDITPAWWWVLSIARFTARQWSASRPGHVNDPDMLEVGNGDLVGAAGWTHQAMWAMLAAPLMIGCDVRAMSEGVRSTLLDPALVALDQDPLVRSGRIVRRRPGWDVWRRQTQAGTVWLVVNTWRRARAVDLRRLVPEVNLDRMEAVTAEGVQSVWALASASASARLWLPGRGAVLLRPAG